MLLHKVFIKPTKEASGEQLEEMCTNGGLLKGIPGVISVHAGKNYDPENVGHGFTYRIFVLLQDQEALSQYLIHPLHEEFASRYVRQILGEIQVFDYPI